MNKLIERAKQRDLLIMTGIICICQSIVYWLSSTFLNLNFYLNDTFDRQLWAGLFIISGMICFASVFITKNYSKVRWIYMGMALFCLIWGFGYVLGVGLADGDYRGLVTWTMWTSLGYINFREIDSPNPIHANSLYESFTSKGI